MPFSSFGSFGSIPALEVLFSEFAKLVRYGTKNFQSD
jgi:hypothetical protein